MSERVAAVLPAWSARWPGYSAVLAMHAFGLEERGDYASAEHAARRALEFDARDARAHHVMAHVFEMTGRPAAGLNWLRAHAGGWDGDTMVARHGNWHMALFHLARGDVAAGLELYDRRIAPGASGEIADLIDASALLWRIALGGADVGARWLGWPRPGRRTSTTVSAASTTSTRCWPSSAHATGRAPGGCWTPSPSAARSQTRHGASTRLLGAAPAAHCWPLARATMLWR